MLISRNFFTFTYDYRREWLRFIRRLSDSASTSACEARQRIGWGFGIPAPVTCTRVIQPSFSATEQKTA